ncbi:MAG: FHA domain-containing protein, partial [Chloroflexota bacterium]
MVDNNCPHCGKPLKQPSALFCTNCGAPVKNDAGQDIETTVHGGSLAKIIVHLPGEETREEFLTKSLTTLGRRRTNMIQVLSAVVSGEHAKIELTRQGHTITDLGSTNGTYLNGKQITPQESHALTSHDIIRFTDGLGNSASLTYIAPSMFTDVQTAHLDEVFTLNNPISYIGRNPDAAIALDHPAVTWNHAKVVKRGENRYAISDLSSNNGTFLNGTQLQDERLLERGDVIQIGPFNLVYREAGTFSPYSAERNFRLEAVKLERVVYPKNFLGIKNKNKPIRILQDLNLVINPREFVALVGGSGTGKSTLMKALSGITPATSGTVLVNGDNVYENYNLYRNMMGYVPQDDIIHQGLEVGQAISYAARLRLPDATAEELKERIDDVLSKVGLTAQAKTLVRDLSGGQRKRVSIAAELLAEPWIFFLDEPTSGLDPGLEKLMMDTLRQLADEGRTIILVTHATSNIANNCDQVAFMARGGQLAYFGPPEEAAKFFKVNDFSDIYTRLSQTFSLGQDRNVTTEIQTEYDAYVQAHPSTDNKNGSEKVSAGSLWAHHYEHSPLYQTYIANRQTGEMARPILSKSGATLSGGLREQFKQFRVLSQRYRTLIRHDTVSLWVLLAVMPIIGIFLLLISNGSALVGNTAEEIAALLESDGAYTIVSNAQTLLFMMALAANLLGVFASSFEIIKEQIIYRRERMINLLIPAYFTSKFVTLSIFMILQCFLLLLVLALKVDMPGSGAIL